MLEGWEEPPMGCWNRRQKEKKYMRRTRITWKGVVNLHIRNVRIAISDNGGTVHARQLGVVSHGCTYEQTPKCPRNVGLRFNSSIYIIGFK